jgi:hypothetical protein
MTDTNVEPESKSASDKSLARKERAMVALCFLLGFSYALWISWTKWGSLIIDTFRDLHVCEMILGGNLLYRDIAYEFGLLPPYLLSLACLVGGVKVGTFVTIGIAATVLLVILVYKTARLFMSRVESLLAGMSYLLVFAFGIYMYHGIFNTVLPYSSATLFFVLCVVAGLYAFLRFVLTSRAKHLWRWWVFMLLAFLCRLDMALFCWVAFALGLGVACWKRESCPIRRLQSGAIVISVPLVAAGIYGTYLIAAHALHGFMGFTIGIMSAAPDNLFAQLLLGWDYEHIRTVGLSFLYQVGCAAILAFASQKLRKSWQEGEIRPAGLYGSVALIFMVFVFAGPYLLNGDVQYRCVPLLLLIMLCISLSVALKGRNTARNSALCTLVLVTTALVIRILMAVSPMSYGFILGITAVVVFYIFFFVTLRNVWTVVWSDFPGSLYGALILAFFIFITTGYLRVTYFAYTHRVYRIESDRGTVSSWNDDTSRKLGEAIRYLVASTKASDKVVAFPEYGAINFLSNRRDPLNIGCAYHPLLFQMLGDDEMIARCEREKIDYLVLMQRETGEYGKSRFGQDYAIRFYEWMLKNYTVVKQIGPYPFTSGEFGIAIFQKKGDRTASSDQR